MAELTTEGQMDLLILLVGPTNAGKDSVRKGLAERWRFATRVSWTTRERKPNEVDGVDYHFRTREEFLSLVEADGFIEHAQVHGHYYGTPRTALADALKAGDDVVFDLDIQGALQLKAKYAHAKSVFIAPSSMAQLRQRMAARNRGESEQEVETRMGTAISELRRVHQTDFIIENREGELDRTVRELAELMSQLRAGVDPDASRFRSPALINRCYTMME